MKQKRLHCPVEGKRTNWKPQCVPHWFKAMPAFFRASHRHLVGQVSWQLEEPRCRESNWSALSKQLRARTSTLGHLVLSLRAVSWKWPITFNMLFFRNRFQRETKCMCGFLHSASADRKPGSKTTGKWRDDAVCVLYPRKQPQKTPHLLKKKKTNLQ